MSDNRPERVFRPETRAIGTARQNVAVDAAIGIAITLNIHQHRGPRRRRSRP